MEVIMTSLHGISLTTDRERQQGEICRLIILCYVTMIKRFMSLDITGFTCLNRTVLMTLELSLFLTDVSGLLFTHTD